MLLRNAHELGDVIRDARRRAGWSQSRLAEAVGVSRQWVSLVENGKTSVEFDLVFSSLQALGYAIDLQSTRSDPGERRRDDDRAVFPVHRTADRTPLTRDGRPLGFRQRAADRSKGSGRGHG